MATDIKQGSKLVKAITYIAALIKNALKNIEMPELEITPKNLDLNGLVETIYKAFNDIGKKINKDTVKKSFKEVGEEVVVGIKEGILDFNSLLATVNEQTQKIKKQIETDFDINSPSKWATLHS